MPKVKPSLKAFSLDILKTKFNHNLFSSRLRLKCDGTCAETKFRLSAKRTSPFKSVGPSVQLTTGSRGVRVNDSNAGYIMFRASVKSIRYPLQSPGFLHFPSPCVTVYHHISTGLYNCAQVTYKITLPQWTVCHHISTGVYHCGQVTYKLSLP